MKINFNRFLLSISLILILILSLGLVSASNYSNDLIDITSDDNAITENSEISDSDLGLFILLKLHILCLCLIQICRMMA